MKKILISLLFVTIPALAFESISKKVTIGHLKSTDVLSTPSTQSIPLSTNTPTSPTEQPSKRSVRKSAIENSSKSATQQTQSTLPSPARPFCIGSISPKPTQEEAAEPQQKITRTQQDFIRRELSIVGKKNYLKQIDAGVLAAPTRVNVSFPEDEQHADLPHTRK
jgi:hypothetical protein